MQQRQHGSAIVAICSKHALCSLVECLQVDEDPILRACSVCAEVIGEHTEEAGTHSSSGQEFAQDGNHVDVNDPIYQVP